MERVEQVEWREWWLVKGQRNPEQPHLRGEGSRECGHLDGSRHIDLNKRIRVLTLSKDPGAPKAVPPAWRCLCPRRGGAGGQGWSRDEGPEAGHPPSWALRGTAGAEQ